MFEEHAELKKTMFGSIVHASEMRLKPHRKAVL
jgi:hypothetical protein